MISGEIFRAATASSANRLGEGQPTTARGTPPPPLPREATPPTPTPPPIGSYDLNGSTLRGTAPLRSTAAGPGGSPFSPAASFSPGGFQTQAPASFIPPAHAPLPSALNATQQSSGPPPSPFAAPPAARLQPVGGSVAPSVAPASGSPGARASVSTMMVLTAVIALAAVGLLTMNMLGKRPGDFSGTSSAAARPTAPVELPPVAETPPPAAVAPPAPAPIATAAPVPTHAPVVTSVVRVTKAPAPVSRAESPASSPRTEGPSSSSSMPGAPSTAASSSPATATSASATPSQASTPASASSDDFGGRQ